MDPNVLDEASDQAVEEGERHGAGASSSASVLVKPCDRVNGPFTLSRACLLEGGTADAVGRVASYVAGFDRSVEENRPLVQPLATDGLLRAGPPVHCPPSAGTTAAGPGAVGQLSATLRRQGVGPLTRPSAITQGTPGQRSAWLPLLSVGPLLQLVLELRRRPPRTRLHLPVTADPPSPARVVSQLALTARCMPTALRALPSTVESTYCGASGPPPSCSVSSVIEMWNPWPSSWATSAGAARPSRAGSSA